MKRNHKNYLKLAFSAAEINLGKTDLNPSVGCVVVKNDTVIAIGSTSKKGRPHAEFNALNKKINYQGSTLYVTMEPCTHYGKTPPCVNLITKKKIKNVIYSFDDIDPRTAKKAQIFFKNKKIKFLKEKLKKYDSFYESYFINKNFSLPLINAKIALSKDFFTIRKSKIKWITNNFSRNRGHLLRSQHDAIISTSKSINSDNSLLNCRIDGLDKNKPDLVIIDTKLSIKKNLKIFKKKNKRKILIVTSSKDKQKLSYFKRRNIKIINVNSLNKKIEFTSLFKRLKTMKYSRILVESGLTFLNTLMKLKLINNIYVFQSSYQLRKIGKNNTSINLIKKLKLSDKINVNLNGDKLYKIKFKNV